MDGGLIAQTDNAVTINKINKKYLLTRTDKKLKSQFVPNSFLERTKLRKISRKYIFWQSLIAKNLTQAILK